MIRRRMWAAFIALAAVAAVVIVVWFQPQKLFIDDSVNEAFPATAGAPDAEGVMEDEAKEKDAAGGAMEDGAVKDDAMERQPDDIASGVFRSLAHEGRGNARLIELPTGEVFLRLEDFEVENGPDLRVYLSAASADADPGEFDDDFLDLGGLKGNIGNQNYFLPASADPGRWRSAVIWCRRFSVGFAVAGLERA